MPKPAKKTTKTLPEVWWKCLHCEHEVHNRSLKTPQGGKCLKVYPHGDGKHFFMRVVRKAKTMDFDLTPLDRKRCVAYAQLLYKALGNPVTPEGARGNLLGAAMAAVRAGVSRKTFLLACQFEYDFFGKSKKAKKSPKKTR